MKQFTFSQLSKPNLNFGGSLLGRTTNPKRARPLDSKLPIHVVLRAERSSMRLPRNLKRVNDLVASTSKRYGIRIYEFAKVGNHCHILLKLPKRRAWSGFILALTGRIAQRCGVTWLHRPFTRVVAGWRKAFGFAKDYVVLNQWEAEGLVSRADAVRLAEMRRSLGSSRGDFITTAFNVSGPGDYAL